MNVKTAIALLQPLKDHHILIFTDPLGYGHQICLRIQHLPPDQRAHPDIGNIILWNGAFTSEGLQAGGTFWAKHIQSITWHNEIARISTRDNTNISIMKLWKLP